MKTIQPRMKNPAMLIPEAMQPFMAFTEAVRKSGVSQRALDLAHLRASQINGCSFCVDMGSRELKKAGETDDRLFSVAAWREAPYFTGAERAALALAEAVTRLSDRSDPVPEEIWNEATLHYDEKGARSPDPLDRHDQLLQPCQRDHQTTGRRQSMEKS